MSLDITAVVRLKHSDLWEAAKKLGGISALALHLGISQPSMYQYVSLRAAPAFQKWPEDKRREVEQKLIALTGKTLEEIFPAALRNATNFLRSQKTYEAKRTVDDDALLMYAEQTRERLMPASVSEVANGNELKERVASVLESLNYREREILKMRYGLNDGCECTLEEVSKCFRITRERVRQIEAKAVCKLRKPKASRELISFIE